MTEVTVPTALSSRVTLPQYAAFYSLPTQLTTGEKLVLDFFDNNLSDEWEIYVKPHLNGLRPDFVLLNQNAGIAAYRVDERDYQELLNSCSTDVDNPFMAARRYKEEIYKIYCPRLQQRSGFGTINAGVFLTNVEGSIAQKLQEPFLRGNELERRTEYWPVVGRDDLAANRIAVSLPLLRREGRSFMRPELADDLRGWLVEPDFSKDQRTPLELDRKQRELAEGPRARTRSGYRRIRGPAGSGKSLVLAARAASLIDEGKDVLVVTFNMTLWHYLRDLIARARRISKNPGRLTFTHFHKWCRDTCRASGMGKAHYELLEPIFRIQNDNRLSAREKAKRLRNITPPILGEEVPRLALKAARFSPGEHKYDAILVDEGQDYQPLWWNALRGALREGGEMVLVADTSQDVYGSAKSWTEEAMSGAGFTGGWATLDVSYRLPPELLNLSRDFAHQFLPSDTRIVPLPVQGELGIFPCTLKWIQCDEQEAVSQSINAILDLMKHTGSAWQLANADITYLSGSNEIGRMVVDHLEGEPWGIRCAHTFAETKGERDRRKMAFFLGRSQLKATTLQSFKGWETRMLVLHIGHIQRPEDLAAAYAAITRLKRSPEGSFLTVVCSATQLNDYGRTWPIYEDQTSPQYQLGSDLGPSNPD